MLVLSLCSSAVAHAQSAADKAAADSLFDEGRKLMAAKDFAKACPKFEASLKLIAQLGTRLNLADCYEKNGKTASAWAEFRAAGSLANKSGDRRAQLATERAAQLEPRISKLIIVVPVSSQVPGLEAKRDGLLLHEAELDTGIPVDPGDHVIEASAPGRFSWSSKITISMDGSVVTVEVPRLAEEPKPEAPAPAALVSVPDPEDARRGHGQRVAGLIVGGVGLLALGASGYFALSASSQWSDSRQHCNANNVCDAQGYQLTSDAKTAGNLATVSLGVGLAVVATGAILYLAAPRPVRHETGGWQVTPTISRTGAAIAFGRSF